ncbi:cytochrome c oxidase subunit 7c [Kwoniella mangroviensis CBS 10435]|uniref:Cytochrome c oxidase subunit 8, mitochondrial n=1 Tax=Kwoniella mangroviensis CBS 10435 TaxID=1331196 RepID=A0A1B9INC5_9TREE|nr:cytochrome c oxidase subunit 7c [Kwoniella mangroviensis CBS 8507]OCF57075.1 cytochrome c oxidase subunit 7c [Kwoniella mangroviensis CBS 10435]OCF67512.1 cytochrome c oxidase subunit 7c [Kwoniella mangroviensis CBS 8507]OCF72758.1 cytochrome c oxidase subunit 7c [Kwoniella mangroviensis CBS 8886]
MSMLLRSAPLRAARALPVARQQVRNAHFENVVDHTIPTNVTNKPWLAIKMIVFTTLGFGTPFFAAKWQMSKSGAA